MEAAKKTALQEALRLIVGRQRPTALIELANKLIEQPTSLISERDLEDLLDSAQSSDQFIIELFQTVLRFDQLSEHEQEWVRGTTRYSAPRRQLIFDLFGFTPRTCELVSARRPVLEPDERPIVISEDATFRRWYTLERKFSSNNYWSVYQRYLIEKRGIPSNSVERIDLSSDEIVGRLADPLSDGRFAARGLVVGHVQSGKTANFTAVIAKAIDAGYRLIIVLTGVHEALRRQTQRRLDMELVGKQNILGDLTELQALNLPQGEYLDDPAWEHGRFVDHVKPPTPRILRLSSHKEDLPRTVHSALSSIQQGDATLTRTADGLQGIPVQIACIKKQTDVLAKLESALRMNAFVSEHFPTLIIDDESDQASVNTAKPAWRSSSDDDTKDEQRIQRKKINEQITDILKLLKRGQYVGYTATPFANVFVDPLDHDDLFPRDFLVALEEPMDYMGPHSFFDLPEHRPSTSEYKLTNREAYVRDLDAEDNDSPGQCQELTAALATYIVAGAIKLFREQASRGEFGPFTHHTMLVHEAATISKQKKLAEMVRDVWRQAAWTTVEGRKILEVAFEDMAKTMADRAKAEYAIPGSLDALWDHVVETIRRVETANSSGRRDTEKVAIVVNSDAEIEERLQFDRESTWKVIIGGNMLSRGFTIEGLTISYFRRAAQAHDTLLQMGRWFGYRPGYHDLVRVFLATRKKLGKKTTVSIYEAFEAITQAEHSFRSQLAIYADWDNDRPAITPSQVFPVVEQHLHWLKPTARTKMHRAQIKHQRENVYSPKAPSDDALQAEKNWELAERFISAATEQSSFADPVQRKRKFEAFFGKVPVEQVTEYLRETLWIDDYLEIDVRPKANYYEYLANIGGLEGFCILLPQLMSKRADPASVMVQGLGQIATASRTRSEGWFGEFTDPAHRNLPLQLTTNVPPGDEYRLQLGLPSRDFGIVLGYVIPENLDSPDGRRSVFTLGLTIYLPNFADRPTKGVPIDFTEYVVKPGANTAPNSRRR